MESSNPKRSLLRTEGGFGGNSAHSTNFGRNLFEFFRTHTAIGISSIWNEKTIKEKSKLYRAWKRVILDGDNNVDECRRGFSGFFRNTLEGNKG